MIPPETLYVPLLPKRRGGKLLVHLNPMSGTWCSVELKKAIEMGYITSYIHAAFKYKIINAFMNNYVELFLKLESCNSGVKNAAECDQLSKAHND